MKRRQHRGARKSKELRDRVHDLSYVFFWSMKLRMSWARTQSGEPRFSRADAALAF